MLPFSYFFIFLIRSRMKIVGYLRSFSPVIRTQIRNFSFLFSLGSNDRRRRRRGAAYAHMMQYYNFQSESEWMQIAFRCFCCCCYLKIVSCEIDKYGIFLEKFVCHSTLVIQNPESNCICYEVFFPFISFVSVREIKW